MSSTTNNTEKHTLVKLATLNTNGKILNPRTTIAKNETLKQTQEKYIEFIDTLDHQKIDIIACCERGSLSVSA